ncbi:MAG: glycoside hydrolase family 16 protein [Tidjanibacter sp.]|nr:glycoside hydrolase family 16 protein [Tidjanibacter sp.]
MTKTTLFALALLLGAMTACGDNNSTTGDGNHSDYPAQNGSGETDGYKLVWQDLFDGNELDLTAWNIEVNGNGGGNAELQYYREENVAISEEPESGRRCLTLTARRENFSGKSFTSGRINSMHKKYFTHGKVEAYICLPKTANGLWPAYWMMGNDFSAVGWPSCGEIDILEMGNSHGITTGTQETFFNGACHWGFYKNGNYPNYAKSSNAPYSLQEGFHLYTLIWDEKSIKMYLDLDKNPNAAPYYEMGIEGTDDEWATGRYFHHDHFILFNLAVGGRFTGILNAGGITALPNEGDEAKMYVDYVRVYQK